MSMRTLIEINHDRTSDIGEELIPFLQRYLNSGSREDAERLERFGIRVLGMRHHSTAYIMDGTPDGFPPQYLERRKGGDEEGRTDWLRRRHEAGQ